MKRKLKCTPTQRGTAPHRTEPPPKPQPLKFHHPPNAPFPIASGSPSATWRSCIGIGSSVPVSLCVCVCVRVLNLEKRTSPVGPQPPAQSHPLTTHNSWRVDRPATIFILSLPGELVKWNLRNMLQWLFTKWNDTELNFSSIYKVQINFGTEIRPKKERFRKYESNKLNIFYFCF